MNFHFGTKCEVAFHSSLLPGGGEGATIPGLTRAGASKPRGARGSISTRGRPDRLQEAAVARGITGQVGRGSRRNRFSSSSPPNSAATSSSDAIGRGSAAPRQLCALVGGHRGAEYRPALHLIGAQRLLDAILPASCRPNPGTVQVGAQFSCDEIATPGAAASAMPAPDPGRRTPGSIHDRPTARRNPDRCHWDPRRRLRSAVLVTGAASPGLGTGRATPRHAGETKRTSASERKWLAEACLLGADAGDVGGQLLGIEAVEADGVAA